MKAGALVGIVALQMMVGCLGDGPAEGPLEVASPSVWTNENATYSFISDDGTLVANITIDVLATNVSVEIDWTIQATTITPDGELATDFNPVSASLDPATGEIMEIRQDVARAYPYGVSALMPTPGHALATNMDWNLYNLASLRSVLPTSLQWPAMHQSGLVEWGELTAFVVKDTATWKVETTAPCQYQCGFAPGQVAGEVQVNMVGSGDGILPQQISQTWGETGKTWTGTRTSHAVAGSPITLPLRAPDKFTPREYPACGDLPCEDGWPTRLALSEGWDAITGSPNWLAWTTMQPDHDIVSFLTAPGFLRVNGADIQSNRLWSLHASTPTGEVDIFTASSARHPDVDLWTPALTSPTAPDRSMFSSPWAGQPAGPRPTLRPLQEYVEETLAGNGFTLVDVNLVALHYQGQQSHPDPRSSALLQVNVDNGRLNVFVFGAWQGQLLHHVGG